MNQAYRATVPLVGICWLWVTGGVGLWIAQIDWVPETLLQRLFALLAVSLTGSEAVRVR